VWNAEEVLVGSDTGDVDSQSAGAGAGDSAADEGSDEGAVLIAFDSIDGVVRVVETLEPEMVVSNHHPLSTVLPCVG
jgi:hypothetical protein